MEKGAEPAKLGVPHTPAVIVGLIVADAGRVDPTTPTRFPSPCTPAIGFVAVMGCWVPMTPPPMPWMEGLSLVITWMPGPESRFFTSRVGPGPL